MSALTPQECIDKLREIESILNKMQDRYRKESLESCTMAKQYVRDDQKIMAMACLRRKKMLEHQMNSISQRILACEQKRLAIEQINTVNLQVDMMEHTANTFRKFLRKNDLDRIQNLQETLQQAIMDTCDINETLSEEIQPLMFDDSELETELQNLILNNNIAEHFPEIPNVEPRFKNTAASSPLAKHAEKRSPVAIF